MFAFILAAAAAALPPPLTAEEQGQLRCVATLAIVADEQKRGVRWSEVGPVGPRGAKYAGLVGDAIAATPGRTLDAVRDWMIGAVAVVRREGLDRGRVDTCLATADVEIAADAGRAAADNATDSRK